MLKYNLLFFTSMVMAPLAEASLSSMREGIFLPKENQIYEDTVEEIQITEDLEELYNWSQDLIELDVPFKSATLEEQDLDQFLDEVFPEYQILPAKKKAMKRSCSAYRNGHASWYGPGFHGKKTANGERFNQNDMTAAHKTIPFNSVVEVTYKKRKVRVRINDAGPYHGGRVIDLSKAAAQRLGLTSAGSGHVTLKVIRCGKRA